jgi:hypothetical protein
MQWYTNVQYIADKMQNYPMDFPTRETFFHSFSHAYLPVWDFE